ncbi:RsbT co-antagonist protein RsbRA [Pseudalkalibacillus caeni]|uniref:STAS domain-containing protein n=1 Tax=Exobacillus caeni TaxID=2574798 RepID=A0A5R9F0G9_9BACL|nr:RsbT co-antagonist protein RsbRA [Pseudalkalibacillus caeni]TLS34908.1 STAS domain-containing protein [Pseudalkalibacillus caeni]
MDKLIIQMFNKNRQEIFNRWMEEMESIREDHRLQNISDKAYKDTNVEFFNIIFAHLERNEYKANDELTDFAEKLFQLGWRLSYLTQGLQNFRRIILSVLFDTEKSSTKVFDMFDEIDRWIDPIINQLINESAKNWENTVSIQKVALQELSAPLIPVFENISVMPLIGTIDTERAKLIMENLLTGVIKHRSQVILIDITGVPVVDTMVAHHIIQASEAVRLVGAQCILVGIRPEIAQTIVNLGIDLGQFPTKSTLYKGMQSALEMTKRKITETE